MSFTYILYQDIHLFHQIHCLHSSVWTSHQRVTGHIYISGNKKLCCQTPRLLLNFPNRLRGHMNFPQPPPRLPEISSTDARYLKPETVTSLGPSEILDPGSPLTRLLEATFICINKILFVVFLMWCGLCIPLNVKITVMWCSYPLHTLTPINPKD